jgi:hypothetical protein
VLTVALLTGCINRGVILPAPPMASERLASGLSEAVAHVMDTYPVDGSFGYYWPEDDGVWWGTTRDIRYLGELVSPGDPEHRSHCVGLTWEVAMAVLQAQVGESEPINGLTQEDILELRADWFVRERLGVGAAAALERYGVGDLVPLSELRRGDFLQFWTYGGSGHSAIFDSWIMHGARVTAMRYWSTHPGIGAIGYTTEMIGGRHIDPDQIYGARIASPKNWRPAH